MKELDLLQDICLEIYGVSLADISIEAFEHLDAVIWAMNTVKTVLLDDKKVFAEPAVLNCTCSCHERGFITCPVNCCDQLNECPVCDCLYENCCDNCGFEEGLGESEKTIRMIDCGNCGQTFDLNAHDDMCPCCGYEELPF